MATPLGWSQGGSGSVCLAFDQLRDVIESQEELIHQLRNVVCRQSSVKDRAGRLPGGGGTRPSVNGGGVASIHGGGRHSGGRVHLAIRDGTEKNWVLS